VNNFRLRYNPLQNANTDIDLALQTPILTTWDLNGVNESIDVFENEIVQKAVNPIDNFETIRYSHARWAPQIINVDPKTSTHYDFYFYSATTDSSITATTTNTAWVTDYRANGFTSRQIYYNEDVFSKSYFKLDFYDSKKRTSQQNLLTIIIPTQQGLTTSAVIGQNTVAIRKPEYQLNFTGDKEGYFVYWLKSSEFFNPEINTLYMSVKFYDASIGGFKKMMNTPQGTLPDKFNFDQDIYFYYTLKLNYDDYTYEVFLENEITPLTKVGTDYNPIKWYEYVNP
jgi:hypothetical protein